MKTTLDLIGETLRERRREWMPASALAKAIKVGHATAHKCAKRWVELGQAETKFEDCPKPPWTNRRRVYRWIGKA